MSSTCSLARSLTPRSHCRGACILGGETEGKPHRSAKAAGRTMVRTWRKRRQARAGEGRRGQAGRQRSLPVTVV